MNARNPWRNIEVGGPAFASDLDNGRRAGTHAELCMVIKLVQMFDILTSLSIGRQASRHLDHGRAGYIYGDKIVQAELPGAERARDGIELARIVHGNINTNSPRQLDGSMAQGLIELARANQPVVVTPFTLCGARVQQNAEALPSSRSSIPVRLASRASPAMST